MGERAIGGQHPLQRPGQPWQGGPRADARRRAPARSQHGGETGGHGEARIMRGLGQDHDAAGPRRLAFRQRALGVAGDVEARGPGGEDIERIERAQRLGAAAGAAEVHHQRRYPLPQVGMGAADEGRSWAPSAGGGRPALQPGTDHVAQKGGGAGAAEPDLLHLEGGDPVAHFGVVEFLRPVAPDAGLCLDLAPSRPAGQGLAVGTHVVCVTFRQGFGASGSRPSARRSPAPPV